MRDEPTNPDAAAIASAARRELLAVPGLPADVTLHPPMPVRTLGGGFDHWYVPVLSGTRLVAFLRFAAGGELHGFSSFLRSPAGVRTAPAADDWINPVTVRRRAETLREKGESVGEPFLSFDGAPDRIAWAVPMSSGTKRRWIFVAGKTAWPQRELPQA